jgi:hypothetical protein
MSKNSVLVTYCSLLIAALIPVTFAALPQCLKHWYLMGFSYEAGNSTTLSENR